MDVANLEKYFSNTVKENPREAAEIAFAIALKAKQEGDNKKAAQYGRKSVKLFERLKVQTMDDCACLHMFINGIGIPDLVHEGVVRSRLAPINL